MIQAADLEQTHDSTCTCGDYRFQWHTGVDKIVRVNSDMMLMYEMKPKDSGRVSCESPQSGTPRTTCKESENLNIVSNSRTLHVKLPRTYLRMTTPAQIIVFNG